MIRTRPSAWTANLTVGELEGILADGIAGELIAGLCRRLAAENTAQRRLALHLARAR